MKELEEYEEQIIDVDEILGTDLKINPDYYIHTALLKAQQALLNEDTRAGFLQYWVLIENIETLCKSAKMLPDDYEDKVKDFEKGESYTKETDRSAKMAKLANYKLGLLMEQVFSHKTISAPLIA